MGKFIKTNMRIVFTIVFISFLFYKGGFAQNTYTIDYVGVEDGLSQGFVTSLLQDREGFIWAATLNGLNRYDGHRFRFFENDPYNPASLPNKTINALLEVGDFLLIATEGDGLNIFHKKTERFYKLPFKSKIAQINNIQAINIDYIPGNSVKEMHLDKNGNIWMVTGNYHKDFPFFVKLSFPKGFWERLPKDDKIISEIDMQYWERNDWSDESKQFNDFYKKIYLCDKGEKILWFCSDYCFSASLEGKNLTASLFPDYIKAPINTFICTADDTGYFLQTENKETWFSQDLKTWKQFSGLLGTILYVDKNKAWVQYEDKIQYVQLQLNDLQINSSILPKEWLLEYPENKYAFCLDKLGNFWRANAAQGLLKINPQNRLFQHFFQGKSVMTSPFSSWSTTYNFPLSEQSSSVFASSHSEEWDFLHSFLQKNNLFLYQIQPSKQGEYWILAANIYTHLLHILKIDANSSAKITDWATTTHSYSITRFKVDDKSCIWFSSLGHLICFNPENEQWSDYDFTYLKIEDSQVFSLEKTNDGALWIGTDKGLIRGKPTLDKGIYPPKKLDFELFTTKPDNMNSLNQNNISSLLKDPKNPYLLWIGTKGGGLNSLDVKNMKFQHFTTKEGLPNNVIYGILSDSLGNLWMSSNKGIFRYNPQSGEIRSYSKYDGIQGDEFNSLAYSKGLKGELMFGGVNGLNVFFPKDLYLQDKDFQVFITNLKINNQAVHVGSGKNDISVAIPYCQELILSSKQNDLTFEFSTFEFKNQTYYYYYLEGIEDEWVHNGTEPFAIYTHLPPGTYNFKVCSNKFNEAANPGSVTSLKVIILPPWHKTTWAYLIYIALLFSLFYAYLLNQKKQHLLKLQIERKEHQIAMNRLKLDDFAELIREKSKLITQLKEQHTPQIAIENEAIPKKENSTPFELMAILTPDDWVEFQERVELAYPNFQQQLKERYPQLSTSEIRILLLAKIGIKSAVESATILGISQESVKKTRFRLRKKINMPEAPLEDILANI